MNLSSGIAENTPDSSGLRESVIVFGTRLLNVVAGLAGQVCLAWFLAPSGRGEFAVCSTFAVLLGIIVGLGFDRAVQYRMIAGTISRPEAVGMSIATTAANCLVAGLIGWFAIDLPVQFFSKGSSEDFRLALLLMPMTAFYTALGLLLDGARMYREGAIVAAMTAIGNLLLLGLLVGLMNLGVGGAIVAWTLSAALGCLLQYRLLGVRPSWPVSSQWNQLSHYAARYYFARVGNAVNVEIGLIVLAVLASTADIGLFAAAAVLVGKLMMAPQALSTVLLPRVGIAMDGQPRLVAQACRISSLFLASGLLALAIVAPLLVPLALSPEFEPAVALVWLMAVGVWARGTTLPISSFFVGINRPGVVSALTVGELLASVLLMVPGYRLGGLYGAAAGGSLAYLMVAIARVLVFRRLVALEDLPVWLPVPGDWRRLLGMLDRVLGVSPPVRQLLAADDDQTDLQRFARSTTIGASEIIKRQPVDLTSIELLKCSLASKISAQTGAFLVPSIDTTRCTPTQITFDKIRDVMSLWQFLRSHDGEAIALIVTRRAAVALAAVHRAMKVPVDMRRKIDHGWWVDGLSDGGEIHGDFTAFNLLVDDNAALWIVDWATSDLLGSGATVGPRGLEVAWFVASLFFESHGGVRRIRSREQLSNEFIDAYLRESGAKREDISAYLMLLATRMVIQRPGLLARLRRIHHELLAAPALLRFAQSTAAPLSGSRT